MFEDILKYLNNGLSSMQGTQGPPTPDGKLPLAVDTGLDKGNGQLSGLLSGDTLALAAPVLKGLLGGNQEQTPNAPAISPPSGMGGGAIKQVGLPATNPGSIAARLRGA